MSADKDVIRTQSCLAHALKNGEIDKESYDEEMKRAEEHYEKYVIMESKVGWDVCFISFILGFVIAIMVIPLLG